MMMLAPGLKILCCWPKAMVLVSDTGNKKEKLTKRVIGGAWCPIDAPRCIQSMLGRGRND